jgi:hypothetical protein
VFFKEQVGSGKKKSSNKRALDSSDDEEEEEDEDKIREEMGVSIFCFLISNVTKTRLKCCN